MTNDTNWRDAAIVSTHAASLRVAWPAMVNKPWPSTAHHAPQL